MCEQYNVIVEQENVTVMSNRNRYSLDRIYSEAGGSGQREGSAAAARHDGADLL